MSNPLDCGVMTVNQLIVMETSPLGKQYHQLKELVVVNMVTKPNLMNFDVFLN